MSRSFLRVMQALAALRLSGARALRWSPQGLLALLFCWVLLTALAAGLPFLGCQLALLLAALMFCDGRCLRRVLGAALVAAVFSLLLAAPAVFWGAGRALLLPVKSFLTLGAVLLVGETVPWHALTGALASLRVPQTVIFLLDTTLRAIFLLGEEAGALLTALKLRSVGRNRRKQRAAGAVLGTLFLRAQRLSEATYEAMVCRGFTGVYPRARAAAGPGAAGVLLPLLAAAFDVLLFLWLEGALARWGVFG
ncbi:MAG: energy-coupling factor transporter transmembrane component T [Oscillospiraceae bacterium]|nr:energy-coupling factor transporter transmembrane component T [Oscillospiraceae bacterium]